MFDIIALGELLVDFTPAGKSAANNPMFEFNPGGSVANFAVAAARLGAKCAFMGKVGQDLFGKMLMEHLSSYGVDISAMAMSPEYMTTLAFVHLFEDGDRDFTFYRKNGADTMFGVENIHADMIKQSKVLHLSSLSLVNPICKAATYEAIKIAREHHVLVTYDPNWRPSLWEDAETCKKEMNAACDYCDVLKVSEEELAYITGIEDEATAAKHFLDRGVKLVIETLGDQGSRYFCKNGAGYSAPYKVKAVDATGAGDACFGAIVSSIIEKELDVKSDIDTQKLEEILNFANASAALSVTKRGGMPAMAEKEQVFAFIKNTQKV